MNIFVGNQQMNLTQNAFNQRSSLSTLNLKLPTLHSPFLIVLFSLFFSLSSCTFNYGESDSDGGDMPNLVMENVEYVRVQSGSPLARIQADRVERYEKQNLMKLETVSFEQYGERGREINAYGRAGLVQIETDTINISMDRGVMVGVESEDIILETEQLSWSDESKYLSTNDDAEVYIYRGNGTRITGIGLRVDARSRAWEFISSVRGTYISDD